ncbi:MAG: 5-bromo-4-chloroindolyl phosphate hydrolysis family protein [Eubacteriales bacterium]
MANNKNNFNFEIPGIIIFLAFVFCWPVGVVLAVLRSISRANRRAELHSQRHNNENTARTYNYNYNYNYQYDKNKANAKNDVKSGDTVVNTSKNKRKSSTPMKLFTAGSIFSFLFAAFFFLGSVANGFVASAGILLAAAVFLAMGFGCVFGANTVKKRDTRLSRIRAIIGNKKSINLTKLASASNESVKKIRKDVQHLIDDGEFGEQAYIDLGTNNFMRNPDAEPDDPEMFDYKTVYGDLLKKDLKKEKEKKAEKSAPSETENDEKSDEKASDKDNFQTIIREIRRLNDEIEDAEVSERIYKIEAHTKNIFDYVTDHPEAMPQIRTFMNYYLPTTLKLLESYSRIERVGVAGENMQKSKNNIEKTLDLLVIGFEQQVDQLFKNEFIDISSDIAVLEQMMQKDGLDGRNDFDISSYANKANAENDVGNDYSYEISDDLTGGAAAQSAPKNKN